MYHPNVIGRQLHKLRSKGYKIQAHPVEKCVEMTEKIVAARGEDGKLKRVLTREERDFIFNEHVMTQIDFRYWAERYPVIELDGIEGGGVGRMKFWESQQILLDVIAKLQWEQWEQADKGYPVDGILIADHKARQVGHTEVCRLLMIHRMTRLKNQRCAGISVDEEKVGELYRRDKMVFKSLPFFLTPGMRFDVKNEHLEFSTDSFTLYYQSNKQTSLGQGKQFDGAHLTELSEYLYPLRIELDFFPTLPQNQNTLCVLESRANGRGGPGKWWFDFSESVRRGRKQRWRYCFIPWYAEPKKYRRMPPENWSPSEISELHAKLVYDTSPEFVGKNVTLARENLYWWESTRQEYVDAGNLHIFLTNYCATPEESFQHSGRSVFPADYLHEMRTKCGPLNPRAFAGKYAVPYGFEAA